METALPGHGLPLHRFSRIRLTNAEEKHLRLRGEWSDETSPYTVYVYELE